MIHIITIYRAGQPPECRTVIGDRDALMDAAYDDGALGVFIRRRA
jgi:hypothetical protein